MSPLKEKSELEQSNFRYNILTTFVYIMGIIILIQLFNLQIVNGSEYREQSNTKLTREAKIEAARGSILDRSGNVLVSTEMKFSLEMYNSKTEDEQLNSSILLMTNILEQNGNSYVDTFPISIDPFEYHFDSEEALAEWKKKYKIPETASPEEAFYIFRDKYNISSDNVKEIRQILAIRYAITTIGYSTTRSLAISDEISRESAVQLQENSQSLTGVNIIVEPTRVYHTGNLASHILGYVSRISTKNQKEFATRGDTHEYEVDDKVGQTGIEKTFEEYLRGEDGEKQIDMTVDGTITGEYTSKEAIGGSDVVLTIDANLQGVAERALAENIQKIRDGGFGEAIAAEGGAVVAINVKNGEILAMASNPDYYPEDFYYGISQSKYDEYNNNPYHPLYSKAYQSTYAPGSTFKMVTAIAALESGTVSVNDYINDSGPYYGLVTGGTKDPACWYYNDYGRGHGKLNVIGAIQKSCNYYFFDVSVHMGIDTLVNYAKYFGLGSKTGIEITGESRGTLASREAAEKSNYTETWSAAQTAYASIGQGLNSFTPLQMAKYVAMVANGGNKLDVSIVKSINQSNGTQVSRNEIDEFINEKLGLEGDDSEDLVISQETIDAVREGMRSVTEGEGGTARSSFRDFEISVGGKTGSAEAGNKTNGWFVGFAPYEDPEIAVVAIIENGFHGYYTADVVKEVIYEYFGMNTPVVTEDMTAIAEMESFR